MIQPKNFRSEQANHFIRKPAEKGKKHIMKYGYGHLPTKNWKLEILNEPWIKKQVSTKGRIIEFQTFVGMD